MNRHSKKMTVLRYLILQYIPIVLLQVAGISLSAAQSSRPMHFDHYTNQEGLASSYVKSIVQDRDGYIWVATRLAVSRFDGKNFRDFFRTDSLGKKQNFYGNKLFLSPDSQLIVLSQKGIYYSYNSAQERFYPYSPLNRQGTAQAVVASSGGVLDVQQ